MIEEQFRRLDEEAIRLFARKGVEAGPNTPQIGRENGLKVRRTMQIIRDLSGRPFEELRILDLGCGEGVYAIEAGLRGAEVVGVANLRAFATLRWDPKIHLKGMKTRRVHFPRIRAISRIS
jgi:2-polyprenyl-3-methyl-5-hydroxy-6-metoxy-1,4-benzoquinol methylase